MTYGYDNLYRLTSETIANAAMNGTVGYQYDAVGNRKQITSTLAAIPSAGLLNYDANDRTTTDQYDANGNTVSQGGIADTYDFENHLIQHGYITYVYDGDGNRVAKGFGGVTTSYLVDTLNPTGYAQVLDELQSNTVARSYTWGLQLVSETQLTAVTPPAIPWVTSYYGFDGHGSVRYLTSSTGAVTDSYDYDAFGNLISSTGTTANNYLFAGEQNDPDLGLYYNRARYLDVRAGRFWGMDTDEGDDQDPSSLHKYLYADADPVDGLDPSGHDDLAGIAMAMAVGITLDAMPSSAQIGAAAVKLARFAALWQNYPSHGAFPTDPNLPNSIWSTIGGHVQMNEWTKDANGKRVPNNTCALRMSYTLNRSGYSIPKGSGANSGADGSWYLLKVKSLQTFLTARIGTPTSLSGGNFAGPSGATGILSFNISGWGDATGHFTLWNGQSVVDPDEPYQRWLQEGHVPTSTLFWSIQ